MYLARATSTWDNLSYESFITGHNASLIKTWENSQKSCRLILSDMPTCRSPSFRQSAHSTAEWILAELKLNKKVVERPDNAGSEDILDIKQIIRSYDMRISDLETFKLIGMEKDGRPNLTPDTFKEASNRAKTLSFHLIQLADTETKLKIRHAEFPLASNIEDIINYRETFASKRVGDAGAINIKQKMPRVDASIMDTFRLLEREAPGTSTPNSSRAPSFTFGTDHSYAETDHSYAETNNTIVSREINIDSQASIPESQLYLSESALAEIEQEAGGGDKEKEEIA